MVFEYLKSKEKRYTLLDSRITPASEAFVKSNNKKNSINTVSRGGQ